MLQVICMWLQAKTDILAKTHLNIPILRQVELPSHRDTSLDSMASTTGHWSFPLITVKVNKYNLYFPKIKKKRKKKVILIYWSFWKLTCSGGPNPCWRKHLSCSNFQNIFLPLSLIWHKEFKITFWCHHPKLYNTITIKVTLKLPTVSPTRTSCSLFSWPQRVLLPSGLILQQRSDVNSC